MRWNAVLASLLTVLVSVTLSGCGAPKEDPAAKAELDKLAGKWKFLSREGDKEEDADPEAEPKDGFYYIVEGNIMKDVFIDKNGKEEIFSRRKLTVSNADKDLKNLDMGYVDENGKAITTKTTKRGITGRKRTSTTELKDLAVYKLEGDKLTICISWDNKRPTDLTAPPKSSRYVLKLERLTKTEVKTEPKVDTPATKPEEKKVETKKPEEVKKPEEKKPEVKKPDEVKKPEEKKPDAPKAIEIPKPVEAPKAPEVKKPVETAPKPAEAKKPEEKKPEEKK
jgi:uncharacterized protein (TIGR03067 family)